MSDITNTIDYNIRTFEALFKNKDYFETEFYNYSKKVKKFEDRIKFINDCRILYTEAVDYLYKESIGVLQDTLDTALQYIIYDKNYSVKLEIGDARGTKTLDILLIDNDGGFEVDLKNAVGNGVRTIISFVLKMYYLLNENSKILFLDEKYSALSAQYVPLFFEFMKKMCDEKGIIIVMITHDPRFMDYADRTYLVQDGNITLDNNG